MALGSLPELSCLVTYTGLDISGGAEQLVSNAPSLTTLHTDVALWVDVQALSSLVQLQVLHLTGRYRCSDAEGLRHALQSLPQQKELWLEHFHTVTDLGLSAKHSNLVSLTLKPWGLWPSCHTAHTESQPCKD